jgi:hypothetical protein
MGNSDLVLRLVPLLSGVAALVLFLGLARRTLTPEAVPIAVALFALAGSLIYYSSELKQYSTDVAVCTLLLLLGVRCGRGPSGLKALLMLGAPGAVAIWFSHPASFVLSGIGVALVASGTDVRKNVLSMLPSFGLWGASFGIVYLASLAQLAGNEYLLRFWADGFMPLPPGSVGDLLWPLRRFLRVLERPGGMYAGLAAWLFVIGAYRMWKRDRSSALMLLGVGAATLFAAALHRYPFMGRLVLFLVPVLILLVAEGAGALVRLRVHGSRIMAIACIAVLMFGPVTQAGSRLLHPATREEVKPLLQYLAGQWEEGDSLYLYYGSIGQFQYYAEASGLGHVEYIAGTHSRGDVRRYRDEVDGLRGASRVWLLFSHVYTGGWVNERELFLYHLDEVGERLQESHTHGAALFLYDLSVH